MYRSYLAKIIFECVPSIDEFHIDCFEAHGEFSDKNVYKVKQMFFS